LFSLSQILNKYLFFGFFLFFEHYLIFPGMTGVGSTTAPASRKN